MQKINFTSMRGTELSGFVVAQKRVARKGFIYLVQRCGRIHAVFNGMAVVDCFEGDASSDELFKFAEREI